MVARKKRETLYFFLERPCMGLDGAAGDMGAERAKGGFAGILGGAGESGDGEKRGRRSGAMAAKLQKNFDIRKRTRKIYGKNIVICVKGRSSGF